MSPVYLDGGYATTFAIPHMLISKAHTNKPIIQQTLPKRNCHITIPDHLTDLWPSPFGRCVVQLLQLTHSADHIQWANVKDLPKQSQTKYEAHKDTKREK